MTDSELGALSRLLDTRLATIEERLRRMVDERNTKVIDAATALVSGMQDELIALNQGLESLSENVAGRRKLINEELRTMREEIAAWQEGAARREAMLEQITAALNLSLPGDTE